MVAIYTVMVERKYECPQVYAFTSINKAIKLFHKELVEFLEMLNQEISNNNEEYREEEELYKIPAHWLVKSKILEELRTERFDMYSDSYESWDDYIGITIERHENKE